MSFLEGQADLVDLAIALIAAEIDGGTDGGAAHIPSHFDVAEKNFVELVGISEKFVVIELYDEGDFVGVFAGDRAQDPEGGGDGVTLAFDGKFDDIFAVEIQRILGGEATVMEHAAKIGDDAGIAIGVQQDAVDEVRAGKMQQVLGDFRIAETEQRIDFRAEIPLDGVWSGGGGHLYLLLLLV